jgi:hypothetical protein
MKATKITIHYDSGLIVGANGDAAAQVMSWWNGCEQIAMNHGAQYNGPKLKSIETINQDEVVEGGREKHGLIVYDGLKNYVKTQGF